MALELGFKEQYAQYKEESLYHRYITNTHIASLLNNLEKKAVVDIIGYSVNNLPIYSITIGNGVKKVLMWSQMHGNESTTTKAVFDMLNTFNSNGISNVLKQCTLCIIPILNPDGALAYTRLNANEVDLNRDAQGLTQPESVVLQSIFKAFQPDFCLNLHGQRTIFSVGNTNLPATVSFLAPAQDKKVTVTKNRKRAMELISIMNKELQKIIPNQVGIYDDAFNINCVGDTFQSYNIPTVLFEAGHITQDYSREKVREYIYVSLMTLLDYVANNDVTGKEHEGYFNIPENGKRFYDIILRHVLFDKKVVDIAIQFDEVLKNEQIHFIPKIAKIGELESFYGHREINFQNEAIQWPNYSKIKIGLELTSIKLKGELFSLKPVINLK